MRFLRGHESERGQAIMIVAGAMTVMLLMVGLAIDTGRLFVERRTMQEAADAGAYAGAVVIYQGGNSSAAISAAVADIALNGYVHNVDDTTVVARVPATGAYTGDDDYVEVLITREVATAILPAIQRAFTVVSVRAVGGAEALNSGYAIVALDRGATDNALDVGQNGTININGAGIFVNSLGDPAADNQGNGSNITITGEIDIAGDVDPGDSWGAGNTVNTGVEQQPDPFAGYPKPSIASMTVYTSMPTDTADGLNDNIITIHPGVYEVEITASGTQYIRMNSGIYVTKEGINGTGNGTLCSTATVNPAGAVKCETTNGGVFIFNTVGDYPAGSGGGCGTINLNGNGRSVLFPMTTGTYAGMLVYQDEDCGADMTISGNGELEATGTIYLPNAAFVMNGNNATLTGSQVVASTVNVQQGNINVTFDPDTTAQPILPRLAE